MNDFFKKIAVAIGFTVSFAFSLEDNLPVYSISLDSADYISLLKSPASNTQYQAVLTHNSKQYPCEIRFRGSSATRSLPKKNWRVEFENNRNEFSARIINFNAEYRDSSIMRNFLAMHLFQFMGFPAAQTEYVCLYVNGQFQGVFLKIEEINADFLDHNNRSPGDLYNSKNHAATMAPLMHTTDYSSTWKIEIGNALDYRDLTSFFSRVFYWNYQDFEKSILQEIHLENILNYFAIEFAITGHDCFTKNQFLYHNPETDRYELFPWDNDASFGNDFLGVYHPDYTTWTSEAGTDYEQTITYHVLFQRLMEYDRWRNDFHDLLDRISFDGFNYLATLADATFEQIEQDVFLDTMKIASNQEFVAELERVKDFIRQRSDFLRGQTFFKRIPLSDFYISNSFPTSENPEVIFQVKSQAPQEIHLDYIENLSYSFYGGGYTLQSVELFDDGQHFDLAAGDSVYANRVTVRRKNLIPFSFRGGSDHFPANDLFYINFVKTQHYALNSINTFADSLPELRFGQSFSLLDDFFIQLFASGRIDLSGCYFQGGSYEQKFVLPENSTLSSSDTLIITTNAAAAKRFFNRHIIIGDVHFNVQKGDTIRILSPAHTLMISEKCENVIPLDYSPPAVIVNEINYHSPDDFDTGDWIELYNPQDQDVNISSWQFKDEAIEHVFVLPENASIQANGFLVLCNDRQAVLKFFPEIENVIGNFDFALGAGGDKILLFDHFGQMIDSLTFIDSFPWPQEADGNGATLELTDPILDNSQAENWAASKGRGTPGKRNSVYSAVNINQAENKSFFVEINYPNPFNSETSCKFYLPGKMPLRVTVHNSLGQEILQLANATMQEGWHSIKWDGKNKTGQNVSSGIYFVRFRALSYFAVIKVVYLR